MHKNWILCILALWVDFSKTTKIVQCKDQMDGGAEGDRLQIEHKLRWKFLLQQ